MLYAFRESRSSSRSVTLADNARGTFSGSAVRRSESSARVLQLGQLHGGQPGSARAPCLCLLRQTHRDLEQPLQFQTTLAFMLAKDEGRLFQVKASDVEDVRKGLLWLRNRCSPKFRTLMLHVLLLQLALTAWLRMAAMVCILQVCLSEALSGWMNYLCSGCLARLASLCCGSNASFGQGCLCMQDSKTNATGETTTLDRHRTAFEQDTCASGCCFAVVTPKRFAVIQPAWHSRHGIAWHGRRSDECFRFNS